LRTDENQCRNTQMTTLTIPTETITSITTATTSILTTIFKTTILKQRENRTATTVTVTATGTSGGIDTTNEALQITGFIFTILLTIFVEAFIYKKKFEKQIVKSYDLGIEEGRAQADVEVIRESRRERGIKISD
jgi:hypothetical protein